MYAWASLADLSLYYGVSTTYPLPETAASGCFPSRSQSVNQSVHERSPGPSVGLGSSRMISSASEPGPVC